MSPIIEQQKDAFNKALQATYTACIFDIDGTLTVRGDEFIPAFLQPKLAELSMTVPMAVCTSRRLDHAVEKLSPLFIQTPDPIKSESNWVLICENGAIGYFFDIKKKKHVELYREAYPYPDQLRKALFQHLNERLKDKLSISFMNVVSMIFRPPLENLSREEIAEKSRDIALLIREALLPFDPKGLLAVSDSGIGVNVFPVQSDKERGIVEFAKHLASTHGFKISPDAREIVAVGDQPEPLGNDEQFLNGKFGTPFTVGESLQGRIFPLPVFDSDNILQGPEATLFLLEQLHFREGLAPRS